MHSRFRWPDIDGTLDALRQRLESDGQALALRSREDLLAGVGRAEQAELYREGLDIFGIAALLFEGVAVRHPLRDGNKRLGALLALELLAMNATILEVDNEKMARLCIDVVTRRRSVDDLAAFLRANSSSRP
jgi:prophage maintenance system killer protein